MQELDRIRREIAERESRYVYALRGDRMTPSVGTLLRIYQHLYDWGHMDLAAEVYGMMKVKAAHKPKRYTKGDK